jgi:hypothetical protein
MANVEVPKSAKIERQFVGTYEGDDIRVSLYTGHASDGFHSNFERRPARWIVWSRSHNGKRVRRQASRFGGKRFAKGLSDFELAVRQLQAEGVVGRVTTDERS